MSDDTGERARETSHVLERGSDTTLADLLRHLFEASPLGILVVSTTGVMLEVNTTVQRMLGYSRTELVGRRFNDITHPEDTHGGIEALKLLISGALTSVELEKRYLCRDGSHIWVALHVTSVRDGDSMFFVTYVEDTTERKRQQTALIDSERRLRATLDALPDAILRVDRDGQILEYKPGADARHAIPAHVFLGRRVQDVLPPPVADRVAAGLGGAGGESSSVEFEHAFADSARAYELQWAPFGRDELLVILRDATERKRATAERLEQQKLIELQRELLRQISAPLMPIAPGVIAVPLIGPLDEERVSALLEGLLAGITAQRARAVILDLTGVSSLDAAAAAELVRAAQGVRLLGAEMVLSGISPLAAQQIVSLDVPANTLKTMGQMQDAIAYALSSTRAK